jgi:hypothetical protein
VLTALVDSLQNPYGDRPQVRGGAAKKAEAKED